MKQVIITALLLLAFLFLLPMVLLGDRGASAQPILSEPALLTPPPVTGSEAENRVDRSRTITLFHRETETVEALSMEDYLRGVVTAEMPASFRTEALKAQTVAARTYALRKAAAVTPRHPDAMVCDDHTCCQAYTAPEKAAAQWGGEAEFYSAKIALAVEETDGLVLTYGGELIDAVFHSSSAELTADAAQVWGRAVPYLVPVSTPEGEEVPNYRTTVTVPLKDFRSGIQSLYPDAVFGEDYTAWFGPVEYTASGAVACLPAGGARVTGVEYRSLFGLRSAKFTLKAGEEGVTFSVTGYGHGAGMSQYGANALAAQGVDFKGILTHYYTGCELEKRRE